MLHAGLLMMVGWAALAFWLLRRGSLPGMEGGWQRRHLGLLLGLVGGVLAIKMVVGALFLGYPADVGTFSAWGLEMVRTGPSGFYREGYFADYPPAYLYVLWAIGGLSKLFHANANSPGFLVLLKLPALLADLGLACLVFRVVHPRDPRKALMVAVLILLSPLAFVDSSLWGQVDSVFTLVLMASLIFLEEDRLVPSAALFALAVLLKPQALVAGPVALAGLWAARRQWKAILQGLGAFLVVALVLVLPFAWGKPSLWILDLYGSTLSSYNYLALNAFNLPALLGGNWQSAALPLWGLEAGTWAWMTFLPVLGYLFWLMVRRQNPGKGPEKGRGRFVFGAAAIYLAFFVLAPKMHERYLYPAAFLTFLAAFLSGDRRLTWIGVGITLTSFWNILETLELMVVSKNVGIPAGDPALMVGSLVNVVLLIWMLRVGHQVYVQARAKGWDAGCAEDAEATAETCAETVEPPAEILPESRPSRRVLMGLGLVVVAYALLAFWNLGNRRGPQTIWKNPSEAVFDLGEVRSIERLDYFHGLGTGSYDIACSLDGQAWGPETSLVNDNAYGELRWRPLALKATGRYLRIRPAKGNLELLELHLEPGGATPRPVNAAGAEALFDEPSSFAPGNSYMDGMYFDEIYHARSGWEISRGIDVTETTHPPFGKVMISWGIGLFGMNPFGYRFMGVLVGILMLPFLFRLARRLTRRDDLALVATLLFALDFMHFTQTRIATIDSFAVFFIMGAYDFMLAYLQTAPRPENQRRATLNLWASGLFIGLAMASKWIGIYAASGLFAIYVVDVLHRPRAWAFRNSITCIGAFLLLPALIYALAYIPYLSLPGRSLPDILSCQRDMWAYHANLKSTHPFSSFWYEWPIMAKPIWYFSNANPAQGTISSIEAFGNPVAWYAGSLAFLAILARYGKAVFEFVRERLQRPAPAKKAPKRKKAKVAKAGKVETPRQAARSWAWTPMRTWSFLLLGGFAQYAPWVVIPRKLAFIYHFFATVPFLILALVLELGLLQRWKPESRLLRALPWMLVAAALACFVACYPVLSGVSVPRGWGVFIQRIFHGIYF